MKEALQDSFRQWYMEYKRINNKFPDFPADEVWQNPSFKFELTPDGQIPTAVAEAEGAKKDESKPSTAASGKGKGGKGDKGGKGKAGKGGDTKKGAAGKKGAKQEVGVGEQLFSAWCDIHLLSRFSLVAGRGRSW